MINGSPASAGDWGNTHPSRPGAGASFSVSCHSLAGLESSYTFFYGYLCLKLMTYAKWPKRGRFQLSLTHHLFFHTLLRTESASHENQDGLTTGD